MITRSPTDDYILRKAGPSGPFHLLVTLLQNFWAGLYAKSQRCAPRLREVMLSVSFKAEETN
jgi:hypothetical protein